LAVGHFPARGGDAYGYIWRIVSILLGNRGSYFPVRYAQKITRTAF
jgi:hypothetical protein